jgi:fatty acid-binding protein DegV
MATTIVTDSGCDLSRSEADALGIEIVPVWILFGEERYRDGIDIDRKTFFTQRLSRRPSKNFASRSHASLQKATKRS